MLGVDVGPRKIPWKRMTIWRQLIKLSLNVGDAERRKISISFLFDKARPEFERAASLTRNSRERELLLDGAPACEAAQRRPSHGDESVTSPTDLKRLRSPDKC